MSAFHGACDSSSAFPLPVPDGLGAHATFTAVSSHGSDNHPNGGSWDAMDTYFECITTCSLEDGECITRCVEELREHA